MALKRKKTKGKKEIIEWIANVLEIDPPSIEYTSEDFLTITTKAMVTPDRSRIIIKAGLDRKQECFYIAHEMRHVWQAKYMPSLLEGYMQSDQLDKEAYNLQSAEIDANAFGVVILSNVFNSIPQFGELTDDITEKILVRAGEITRELNR